MEDKNLAVENGPRYNARCIDAEVRDCIENAFLVYLTHAAKII